MSRSVIVSLALVLSVVLCASLVSASDTLYVCKNRQSNRIRLVTALAQCQRGEDAGFIQVDPGEWNNDLEFVDSKTFLSRGNPDNCAVCIVLATFIDGSTTEYRFARDPLFARSVCQSGTYLEVLDFDTDSACASCFDPSVGYGIVPALMQVKCKLP